MKRPIMTSTIAIIAGLLTVIATLLFSTWIISQILSYTNQIKPLPLFTNDQIHLLQAISIVIGALLGAFVTSLLSPGNEIRRSVVLGVSIIVFSALGTIRSHTQTLFDASHVIIYLFTIPCTWISAYLVQSLFRSPPIQRFPAKIREE